MTIEAKKKEMEAKDDQLMMMMMIREEEPVSALACDDKPKRSMTGEEGVEESRWKTLKMKTGRTLSRCSHVFP